MLTAPPSDDCGSLAGEKELKLARVLRRTAREAELGDDEAIWRLGKQIVKDVIFKDATTLKDAALDSITELSGLFTSNASDHFIRTVVFYTFNEICFQLRGKDHLSRFLNLAWDFLRAMTTVKLDLEERDSYVTFLKRQDGENRRSFIWEVARGTSHEPSWHETLRKWSKAMLDGRSLQQRPESNLRSQVSRQRPRRSNAPPHSATQDPPPPVRKKPRVDNEPETDEAEDTSPARPNLTPTE